MPNKSMSRRSKRHNSKGPKPVPVPPPAPKPVRQTNPDSATRAWMGAVIHSMSKEDEPVKPKSTMSTFDQHRQSLIVEYKPSAPGGGKPRDTGPDAIPEVLSEEKGKWVLFVGNVLRFIPDDPNPPVRQESVSVQNTAVFPNRLKT